MSEKELNFDTGKLKAQGLFAIIVVLALVFSLFIVQETEMAFVV